MAEGLIEIKLNQVQQLFSTHDPAPFRERDLDDDAVEYIVESLKILKSNEPVKIIIYLPADQISSDTSTEIELSIHHYFSYEATLTVKKIKTLLKQGQLFFLIALVFLFSCMYVSHTILIYWQAVWANIIAEGLNIIGWVAMWRPVEIFLYDWHPMKRARNYYRQLSKATVVVTTESIKG